MPSKHKSTKPKKEEEGTSSVVKRTCSFPKPLWKFAGKQAKKIAQVTCQKPNISGYISGLIAAEKARVELVESI